MGYAITPPARVLTSLLLILLAVGCGDEGPTAPDPDLVGSWEFTGSDMADVILDAAEDAGAEVSQSQRDSLRFGLDAYMSTRPMTIRFNPDGTWEDDSGDSGTWSVDGNELTTEEGDPPVRYFVDADELTLIFPAPLLIEDLVDEDDPVDRALADALADEVFRLFFSRR